MDFRSGILLSLKHRRFDHWTPQYLRYRIQAAVRAALRPGSGNTTRFLARRTTHLTSFETTPGVLLKP